MTNRLKEHLAHALSWRFERRMHSPATILWAARMTGGRLRAMDAEEIAALQARRVRDLVAHVASHSPFYRTRLREAKIQPERVEKLGDLAGLPFTTGGDLQKDPAHIRCAPQREAAASFLSAGTTGAPKRIDYCFGDVQAAANTGALLMRSEVGDGPVAAAIAMPLQHGLWIGWRHVVWTIERAGGLALTLGAHDAGAVAESMLHYRTNQLMTTPSFALSLARAFGRGERPPLSRIVLGADVLDRETIRELAEAFPGAEIHSSYGTTELGVGLGTGWDSETAIVFNELAVGVEIVDPETGEPAEEGELVYTTLARRMMPLLRYRSGDRARFAPHGAPYAFRAVEVLGRMDELLLVAGSNLPATEIADEARRLVDDPGLRVAIRLDRRERPERLTLRIGAAIDEERLRARLFDRFPRLAEHVHNGELRLEIETGCDLSSQLKPLAIERG